MSTGNRATSALRRPVLVLLACLALVALAACGGDDDDDGGGAQYPRFSGADVLDSAEPTQEDLDDINAAVTDAETTLLKADAPYDEVADYYTGGVEDDGWVVFQDIPAGDDQIVVVLSNDTRVAAVYLLAGAVARDAEQVFADEGLELDPEDVDDDDTVILVTHLTCQERVVADCLAEFAQ